MISVYSSSTPSCFLTKLPSSSTAMGDLSPDRSALVEAWLVGSLFGANLVLFGLCIGVLNQHARARKFRYRCMQVVATVQILIAAAHAAALLARIVQVLVFDAPQAPSPTPALGSWDSGPLSLQTSPPQILVNALYIANDVIGSSVLVWRCYIVWGESLPVVAPMIISSIATAACGFTGISLQGMMPSFSYKLTSGTGALMLSFWALSFATQITATSLIAWKIWSTIAWRSDRRSSIEWAVIRITIESGAIYSATTIVALILYIHDPYACELVSGILTQISAMVPYLIIVRRREGSRLLQQEQDAVNGPPTSGLPLAEIPVILSRKARRQTRYNAQAETNSDTMIDLKSTLPPPETELPF